VLKNFLSFSGAEGISKGLNWATIALLPLLLIPEEYGLVGLLIAMEGILSNVTLLGQEKAVFKFNSWGKYSVLHYSIRSVLVVITLLIVMVGVSSLFVDTIFGVHFVPTILALTLAVFFQNFARLLMAYSRIKEDMRLFWRTRLFYQVLKSTLVIGICAWSNSGYGYIYAALLAGVTFTIGYRSLLVGSILAKDSWNISRKYSIILGFGVPLIFHAMSGNILSYADRFFLERYLDFHALGVYTFVYSIGSSIFFFYGTVSSYFEPLTYRYQADTESYRSVLRFYLTFVLLCASIMSVVIDTLFEPLILPFVSSHYVEGSSCLKFILAAHLLIPFYTIANYELAVRGKTKTIAFATVVAACANLSLNGLLIPALGIDGAAVATLLTYFLLSLLAHFIVYFTSRESIKYVGYVMGMFILIALLFGGWSIRAVSYGLSAAIVIGVFSVLLGFCWCEFRVFKKLLNSTPRQ